MLDQIPAEVLGLIVGQIHTQSDLKNLCEVSKQVAVVATPRLYESITLHAGEGLGLDDLKHKIELCCNANLNYTKHICLQAPLHHNLRERCPHYDSDMPKTLGDTLDMDDGSEVDFTSLDPFWDLYMALDDLLGRLKENTLQSFSWNLGCCIPGQLLDLSGSYWMEKQKHIQSISLLTDGGCPTHVDYLNLEPFTNLQSLSWKGLIRGDHFDCLASFIKKQVGARNLKSLTLDFVKWTRAEREWHAHQKATLGGYPPLSENFFATKILGIKPHQRNILFQSLETLRLTGLAFSPFENELAHSFNIRNLSTLQLRNCPSSLELLGALLEQDIALKLKCFELSIDWDCLYRYRDLDEAHTVVIFRFLDSFQGLKDLFLLLAQPIEWYLVMNSIAKHRSTLKRLVVHERRVSKGVVVDGALPWHNSGDLLFHESKLSCLGTGGPICEMESAFKELHLKPHCKILHIKKSWIDRHREYEEALRNVNSEDSDFEDLGLSDFRSDRKFPSNPRVGDPIGISDAAQANSVNQPSSSQRSEVQGLTMKSQFSRTRKFANRSNFSGSTQQLLKFARWAFSPEGLPGLQVLAWGDFSNDGRWGESNGLLCRDESIGPSGINFRVLRDSDFAHWDLIEENLDMLSACSPDHLLWTEDDPF